MTIQPQFSATVKVNALPGLSKREIAQVEKIAQRLDEKYKAQDGLTIEFESLKEDGMADKDRVLSADLNLVDKNGKELHKLMLQLYSVFLPFNWFNNLTEKPIKRESLRFFEKKINRHLDLWIKG